MSAVIDLDSAKGSAELRSAIAQDSRSAWAFAKEAGLAEELRSLQSPRPIKSSLSIGVAWAVIVAIFAVLHAAGAWFVPVAVLLVARQQRVIAVLIHDAGHSRLFRSGKVNDRIANWFLCSPMFVSIGPYREIHLTHHKYLGDPDVDIDFFSPVSPTADWQETLFRNTVSWSGFKGALFGALPFKNARCYPAFITWWTFVAVTTFLLVGAKELGLFLLVWLLGRVTLFHVVSTFVIISDHFGLTPGSVLSYTRNHPTKGLIRRLLHPHNNGYHLTHHLLPGIPHHALPAAHKILRKWGAYAEAPHHERYFLGDEAVVKAWTPNINIEHK